MCLDFVAEDGSLLDSITFDKKGRARLSEDDHRRVARRKRYKQMYHVQRALKDERVARRSQKLEEQLRQIDDGFELVTILVDKEGRPSPAICGRYAIGSNLDGKSIGSVKIMQSEEGQCHVGGVIRCKSVWCCPVCGSAILSQRAAEIDHAVKHFEGKSRPNREGLFEEESSRHYMQTLTFSHKKTDALADIRHKAKAAQKRLAQSKTMRSFLKKCSGYITTTEITYSDRNGWHLHFHRLFLNCWERPEMESAWLHALSKEGLKGKEGVACDVREAWDAADYMAKTGIDSDNRKWSPGRELSSASKATKQAKSAKGMQPWELAENRPELMREFYHATRGMRRITFSRGLKQLVGLDDNDSDDPLDESELFEIVTIKQHVWTIICRSMLVTDALECAELGGANLVRDFVDEVTNNLDKSYKLDHAAIERMRAHRRETYRKVKHG